MVANWKPTEWRRAGCTDACEQASVLVQGLLGRQLFELHDPEAHELWGRANAEELTPSSTLESGPLVFDRRTTKLCVDGREVTLTKTELRIFLAILDGNGGIVTQAQVLTTVWGIACVNDTYLIRVHITRLRQRLGLAAGLIESIWNAGYRFRFLPPGEIPDPPKPRLATLIERKRWANKYPCCQDCGTTERAHRGRGYCVRCYSLTRPHSESSRTNRTAV